MIYDQSTLKTKLLHAQSWCHYTLIKQIDFEIKIIYNKEKHAISHIWQKHFKNPAGYELESVRIYVLREMEKVNWYSLIPQQSVRTGWFKWFTSWMGSFALLRVGKTENTTVLINKHGLRYAMTVNSCL